MFFKYSENWCDKKRKYFGQVSPKPKNNRFFKSRLNNREVKLSPAKVGKSDIVS